MIARLLFVAALSAPLGGVVPAARAAADPHVVGSFALSGVVTTAYNVRGEYRGQSVKRSWSFQPLCSTVLSCERLVVTRVRASGGRDTVMLWRVSRGVYRGRGSYTIPLQCGRRKLVAGGIASYSLTVRTQKSRVVHRIRFATQIAATYKSVARVNGTRCPGFLGRDAASYRGSVVALPTRPTTSFTYTRDPTSPATFTFAETSTPGRGGAPIIARSWDFGDPASGPANTDSSATPSHTFVTPGVHTVTLTVTDANGFTARIRHRVTASAPAAG